jgi:hypothetical protein
MSATAQLALDVRGFLAGMDLAKQGLTSFRAESGKVDEGSGMARLQVAAVALAATVAALGVAMYKGVVSTIELGATMVDTSNHVGLTVRGISILGRSLQEVGGIADDVAPSTQKFNQGLQDAAKGAGPLVGILKDAGISMESLAKMSVAERMEKVAAAIGKISHPTKQAQAAAAAFGEAGVKMVAALKPEALNSAAAAMGSQAQIMQANAGVFARIMQLMGAQGSSLNSLAVAAKGKLQGLFTGIAAGVAPTVLKIMEASATGGMSLAASIRQFSPALEPLAALVESLVKMDLAGVGAQLGAGAAAIAEAIMNGDAIEFLKAGLVVAGVKFKMALQQASDGLSEAFTKAKDYLGMPNLIEQLKAGMTAAGTALMGIIQKGLATLLQSLRNSSDFLQNAIKPETVLALANAGAKASKDASTAIQQAVQNLGTKFEGGGISQQDQTEADEARKRMAEIIAKATAAAGLTATQMRKKFATPAAGEQALTDKKAVATQPNTGIFSSMAKIGGDVGGGARGVDVSREQLAAQKQTANNTAKMIDKLDKLAPAQSTQTASIYS